MFILSAIAAFGTYLSVGGGTLGVAAVAGGPPVAASIFSGEVIGTILGTALVGTIYAVDEGISYFDNGDVSCEMDIADTDSMFDGSDL